MGAGLGDDRREELITSLARLITRYGLKAPAIWLLEMHKPLGFLGGQALLFSQPLLGPFLGDAVVRDYASLLEDRDSIDRLLELLERESLDKARRQKGSLSSTGRQG